jgi:hypothetical protein
VRDEPSDAFDEFDAIAEGLKDLGVGARSEQLGEAHEIVAAGIAQRTFLEELRRISAGEVVTVVGIDGVPIRGRIVALGADWLRVGEVADEVGSRRSRLLRVHDVRLGAVVRVSRESAE